MERIHKRTIQKDLHDQITTMVWLLTYSHIYIMECKVKWALGSITTNKARGSVGIPAELFQILKYKCFTQYASKFGKFSSGHRTGKGQFSFQSQRKAMPKNVQTTSQLHSSHTLAKQCSKFSEASFNSMWIKDFQMFNLVSEKTEGPKIKLPASVGSLKKQESSRKTYLLYWLQIATNCGEFFKRW